MLKLDNVVFLMEKIFLKNVLRFRRIVKEVYHDSPESCKTMHDFEKS